MSRVDPSGSVPCDLAIFGEMPGWEEAEEGIGFVGKAGQELWAGLKRFCQLKRSDFYVSNFVKEYPGKGKKPSKEQLAQAYPEFFDEICRVKPRIVITAGGYSTYAALGNLGMAAVHGIPHQTCLAGHECVVFPIYHPAAGLHNKGFLSAFAYDLRRLRLFLDGSPDVRAWQPSPLPQRSEWLLEPATTLDGLSDTIVGIDNEGWPDKPWGVQFSLTGDHSFVIRADNEKTLAWLRGWILRQVPVGHNVLGDLPRYRAMGIDLPPFHDTMVLAYHDMMRTGSGVLEQESQNLGTLAYRELGMMLGEITDVPGVDLDKQILSYGDEMLMYAGDDAMATRRLYDRYAHLATSQPYQIDMGQVRLVDLMQETGFPFELDDVSQYYVDVIEKLQATTQELKVLAGRRQMEDFNPRSHPQVRELLTERLHLRVRRRTRGGKASTDEKSLADHQKHPVVQVLQLQRELEKLRGTYLEPLLEELS